MPTAFFGPPPLLSYAVSIPLGCGQAPQAQQPLRFPELHAHLHGLMRCPPTWWVGSSLITVFLVFHLEWLPMGLPGDEFDGMESSWDQIRTVFAHALLPLIAYAIGDFAILTMTMKNSLMENLSADYVRTAGAKGLPFARR